MIRYGTFGIGTKVETDSGSVGVIEDVYEGGLLLIRSESGLKWYYLDELYLQK